VLGLLYAYDYFVVIAINTFSDNQTSVTPTKAANQVSTLRPKGSVIDLTEDDDDVQGNQPRGTF